MAKNVIRRQFSNMYGKDKSFQENSNVKLPKNNFTESNTDTQFKKVIKNEFKNDALFKNTYAAQGQSR